jgi:hypothetical protein
MVNHSSGSKGYLLLTNGASIGSLVTNGTAVELFNVNGYGIGVEGTSDVYVLTNWTKKTMLHAGNYNSYAPTLTGTGASGTWGIDITGNAATATKLQTARTIWGQSFDGTANVDGKIYQNGKWVFGLHADENLFIGYDSKATGSTQIFGKSIEFYNSIGGPTMLINSSGNVTIGAGDYAQQNCKLFVDGAINVGTYGALHRDANNHLWVNYGGSAAEKNLILCGYNTFFYYGKGSNYKSAMFINSSGNVGIGTTAPDEKLHVVGNLHVTGNIIADGEVSAGGVATEGTGGATGGSGLERKTFTIPANTTSFTCEHNLATKEISVSIYEDGNDYQQILTDVYLDNDNTARIVFGGATDVVHKVVIIG